MAKVTSGMVLRKKLRDGSTTFSVRFGSGGNKWMHRLGNSKDGWDEQRVEKEREHLARMIERGEYVRPETSAPMRPSQAPGLRAAAQAFYERQKTQAESDYTPEELRWRLRHAIDFFGNAPIDSLTYARIEDFQIAKLRERQDIEQAAAAGRPLTEEYTDARGRRCVRARRGLGRRSINKVTSALQRLLDDAVRRGELDGHPCPSIKKLRNPGRPRRSFAEIYQATAMLDAARQLETEHRGLTWEKVEHIRASPLSAVKLGRELGVSDVLVGKVRRGLIWTDRAEAPNRNDVPRYAPVVALMLTGVRVSELCGWDGEDLDLAAGRVHVPRDITKSDAGVRTIPLLPVAHEALLDHVMQRPPPGATGAVFTNRNGGRQTPGNVRKYVLAPVVARANETLARDRLPPILRLTPHSLRRTFASLLSYSHVPEARAMYLLGHTDPTLTIGVYTQMLTEGPGGVGDFEKLTGATRAQAERTLRADAIGTPNGHLDLENAFAGVDRDRR